KELVRALNQNGILIDLSHLNEKGFWQVADLTEAPLVASHSNAWELCRSTRNLTDKQLEAIAESEGLVGVNFCVGFLRADGRPNTTTPISVIADHVDYIAQKAGIDHVAFGSDFDGATIPDDLGDVTGYAKILAILRQRGYAESDLRKICCDNWLRVLRATWHRSS
ncbi:MAG: peptidase, partial [bacterium]|nr:peptidase [bacterium]